MYNIVKKIWNNLLQFIKYRFFKLFSLKKNNNKYYDLLCLLPEGINRLPESLAAKLTKGLSENSKFPAGKKICFQTNAESINLDILYKKRRIFSHMSNMATSGLDIYIKEHDVYVWKKCISPRTNTQMRLHKSVTLGQGVKDVVIYLPAFAIIDSLSLKIKEYEYIEPLEKKNYKNLAVYGSSISQGCAASRPSLSYANLLTRNLNYELLNFGFSESAKGEELLIEYISTFNIDVFVVEYDHNASLSELKLTHRNVYKKIRNNNNCLIILMSRFTGGLSISYDEEKKRTAIIKDTYKYAIKNGDTKIAMIDGGSVFKIDKGNFFIDDRHPNDTGMRIIAEEIEKVIKERGFLT